MSDYILLIPLLVGVIAVLHRSKIFPNIVRYIGYGYFFVLTLVFIIVRERISSLYEHPPIPDMYWEKNSNWADIALLLYLLPTVVIFLILCFFWMKREQELKEKILIFLFFVVVLVMLFVYAFFFSMTLGYRP
ncbi:hypothetical protein [Virgibacillus alimentarius]|uniref:Phosphoglycerol transferase MdoB-like AlkP superfamily enzyme n=1 Tax=Virgibacillus alimentarius TaxID=698769 RepID=A0ABS4SDF0_9BACI|nr:MULTISPECIES: hypothetical protein [Virgibacillus]MBP2258427.1 phosphoglycerol transferase MdoB-like AlkP superfamily enzyme [Virgibacillus alimentarius]HLR68232.1 hypothetical protein [Virgibacillus sp.]